MLIKKTEVVAEMLVTCPSNHENLTWIVLGSNWFLRDDRPVNNLPSQGTDIRRRHSPLFFYLAKQPPVGHRLLVHEVPISHTTAHHSR